MLTVGPKLRGGWGGKLCIKPRCLFLFRPGVSNFEPGKGAGSVPWGQLVLVMGDEAEEDRWPVSFLYPLA